MKKYSKPTLVAYGSMTTLTQGVGSIGVDTLAGTPLGQPGQPGNCSTTFFPGSTFCVGTAVVTS